MSGLKRFLVLIHSNIFQFFAPYFFAKVKKLGQSCVDRKKNKYIVKIVPSLQYVKNSTQRFTTTYYGITLFLKMKGNKSHVPWLMQNARELFFRGLLRAIWFRIPLLVVPVLDDVL